MQLQDIMSSPVFTVKATATVEYAAEMMALHDVGALPVTMDDALVGIVTDRDIVLRCLAPGLSPAKTDVARIMSPNPVALPPNASVDAAAQVFKNTRVRRLPVVDQDRPVGMITVDDIARASEDDASVLQMVRRVAPRRYRRVPAAG